MENERSNSGLVGLAIILSLCILGLVGYIIFDKTSSNESKINNVNKNVSSDKTFDNKYQLSSGVLISFADLGLNLTESFKKEFKITFNGESAVLTVENNYKVVEAIDENTNATENLLSFYIDDDLITKNVFKCGMGCQKYVDKITIYDNKYLALSYIDVGSNGWMSAIEELHLYDKTGEKKVVKSIKNLGDNAYNTDIYLDGGNIYYYAGADNSTKRTADMSIYKYKTTIEDGYEQINYVGIFDENTGTIKE